MSKSTISTSAPPGWPASHEIARANLLRAVDKLRAKIAQAGTGASELEGIMSEFGRVWRETKIFLGVEECDDPLSDPEGE